MPELSMKKLVGQNYDDFWRTRKRYRVCKGSRGSKKSKTAAYNRICRLIQYPLSNYLCVRRYGNTLRDSIYADTLWAIHNMGLDDYFTWIKSPMEIVYKPTGQKVLFRGLDDGLKVTSITVDHGFLNFVDIEEAYEISEDDFNKLEMSIRGELPPGYFKQITLLFNPWSATSWLKRRFFDEPDKNTFIKTTTWQCNEWLGDDDRDIFLTMKEKNPRRYRIEGDGDWGIADGLIFPNHRIEDFNLTEIKAIPGIKEAYGLDFGVTDPNAFVALMVDEGNKRIYVFDEWYGVDHENKQITNKKIAAKLIAMGYGSRRIICDSAEPKSITELQDEGIRAEASRKGRDSVNHGIQMIQNYDIIIAPRCVEFYKAIENYCWAKDRNGNPTDKPDHEFSHGMDAMRYAVNKILLPDCFSFD